MAGRILSRKADEKPSEAATSQGIGESKTFVAPPGDPLRQEIIDWETLTIHGDPIPQEIWGKIPFKMTDQGADWANAKEPSVQVTRDGERPTDTMLRDRTVEQHKGAFADSLMNEMPLEENFDPLRLAMDRHLPPGQRGLWLGDAQTKIKGMRRGVLEYKPVMVEVDGVKQPVRVGSMVLASVPEERAKQADQFYINKGKRDEQKAVDEVRGKSAEIASEATLRRGRKADTDFMGGVVEEDGEMVVGELQHEFNG